jgi:hypothetical protein
MGLRKPKLPRESGSFDASPRRSSSSAVVAGTVRKGTKRKIYLTVSLEINENGLG